MTIVQAPEASTLHYTRTYQSRVEGISTLIAAPGKAGYFCHCACGPAAPVLGNQGILFSTLVPLEARERRQQELVKALLPRLLLYRAVLAFPTNPPSLGRSFLGQPISFVVQGNDHATLFTVAREIMTQAQTNPRGYKP